MQNNLFRRISEIPGLKRPGRLIKIFNALVWIAESGCDSRLDVDTGLMWMKVYLL